MKDQTCIYRYSHNQALSLDKKFMYDFQDDDCLWLPLSNPIIIL